MTCSCSLQETQRTIFDLQDSRHAAGMRVVVTGVALPRHDHLLPALAYVVKYSTVPMHDEIYLVEPQKYCSDHDIRTSSKSGVLNGPG